MLRLTRLYGLQYGGDRKSEKIKVAAYAAVWIAISAKRTRGFYDSGCGLRGCMDCNEIGLNILRVSFVAAYAAVWIAIMSVGSINNLVSVAAYTAVWIAILRGAANQIT